jgi:hypothetical protein
MPLTLENRDKITADVIIKLGNVICANLNAVNSYFPTVMRIEEEKYFWTDAGNSYEEIVGRESAWEDFNAQYHPGHPDFFENNEKEIFMYFKRGNLSPSIGRILGAPQTEIVVEALEDDVEDAVAEIVRGSDSVDSDSGDKRDLTYAGVQDSDDEMPDDEQEEDRKPAAA